MAGGKLAATIPCLICLEVGRTTPASRIYEGDEDDEYRCDEGHTFGMSWAAGAAKEPLWPPSPAMTAAMATQKAKAAR